MFHMLTCFNLRPGVTPDAFVAAYGAFVAEMVRRGLAEGSGPVGQRRAESGLDTDTERDHGYFALISFRDRDQSEAAFRHIKSIRPGGDPEHEAALAMATDMIFIAWEDL